jgi:hypothetical protein
MTTMDVRFAAATLKVLDRVREVEIETTSLDGEQRHRTIIWIVVVRDEAYIRSEYAEGGRWYREARSEPRVILHAEGTAIPVTAILANDAKTIEQVSDAFRAKYGKRSPGSTAAMVAPHTLETTLRLDPRDAVA